MIGQHVVMFYSPEYGEVMWYLGTVTQVFRQHEAVRTSGGVIAEIELCDFFDTIDEANEFMGEN